MSRIVSCKLVPFLGHNFQAAGKCRDVILGVLENQRASTQSGVGRYGSGERYAGRLVREGNGLKRANRVVEISLPGGKLAIEWRERDDHVLMTGTAAFEYEGRFDPALFASVA